MRKEPTDVKDWEKSAWIYICDVADQAYAWARMLEMSLVEEPMEEFIQRIEKTRWHKWHKRHHHGHHPYSHDDHD